jgi:hypothetical protein
LGLGEIEPLVNIFFFPDDIGRFQPSFFKEPLELGFGEGFFIIINSREWKTAFLYQLDDHSAGGAGGFLVNDYFRHVDISLYSEGAILATLTSFLRPCYIAVPPRY